MATIQVEGLTRTFDEVVAVDGISFTVEDGEIFGLLGPNGAGKTTTINMLTTLLSPTGGRATVGGADIATERDRVRQQIGVVFQEPALDTNLTARENLDFHAMMYGIPRQAREDRIAAVLGLVELDDRADDLVSEYSGGMKRRLEIARGLIQRPKVLFLDEPTLGLDAQTRRRIWEYVEALNRDEGVTVVLTTHYMEEADYLCDRVAIIDHGKISVLDTPEALKTSLGGDLITLGVEGDDAGFKNRLHEEPWVRQVGGAGQTISIVVEEGDRRVAALVAMAAAERLEIVSVNLRQPSLEDVFLHVTGRTIREA
ncbi:ABC-2 type transport system ATP-binding protein [Methanofollis sp. W23]|uniref:ATP-binding cassette domain-containing protein n=1 Tax=Methanofollis sp. W23 TaxID=2817849 RepID=UPI001AE9D6AD|nr:ATP-binding cassette domain-containing protein [Methanofollis sp. W23]MBP2146586.1 ABC-2 type transport system ATP-binding protein [Methanofollis sp. W23]